MTQTIAEIAAAVKGHAPCSVCSGKSNHVPGSGNPQARVVFIGEAPGAQEEKQGIPFVGAAGKFLNEMLGSVDMKREDIYITNVVKCRPPNNRDPLPHEVTEYWPYLRQELLLIKPQLVILLGRHAMNRMIPNLKIGEAHGKPKRYRGQVYIPMYHPAAALYNGSLRTVLLQDFQIIPVTLEKLRIEQQQGLPEYDEPTNLEVGRTEEGSTQF